MGGAFISISIFFLHTFCTLAGKGKKEEEEKARLVQ